MKRELELYGIEYAENTNLLFCCLDQNYEGIAFSEIIEIKIRKLPLRSVYGVQVTGLMHQTRSSIGSNQPNSTKEHTRSVQVRNEFAKGIKSVLADAEGDVTAQQQLE